MEVTASSGQPQLTPASFLEDKQQDFKQVMSSITGQPAEWIEVAAKWGQQTTVLVLSQIHAPLDQLPAVREKLEAAVASQSLEVQLQAIQLDLVPGSVAYTRNDTDLALPPPRPPPGSGQRAPPPPPPGGQAADAGGGSSNSTTIAIVVPVVVVTVLAIAGGGTAVYMRKRRGQQAAAEAAAARQERRASRLQSQAGAAGAAGSPPAGSSGPAGPNSPV